MECLRNSTKSGRVEVGYTNEAHLVRLRKCLCLTQYRKGSGASFFHRATRLRRATAGAEVKDLKEVLVSLPHLLAEVNEYAMFGLVRQHLAVMRPKDICGKQGRWH